MGTPYIGEIRILPYTRGAPEGWQICDGSVLSIAGNDAFYAVIGSTYGGDGQSSFAVPDLRSRVPVHQGNGPGLTSRILGQVAGTETVTLVAAQMGQHTHAMVASSAAGTSASPAGAVLAAIAGVADEVLYDTAPTPADAVPFPATMVTPMGAGMPHGNTAPTLTLQYCIATDGIFPNPN